MGLRSQILIRYSTIILIIVCSSGAVTVTTQSATWATSKDVSKDVTLFCRLSGAKQSTETIEWRKYNHETTSHVTIYNSATGDVSIPKKYKVTPSSSAFDLIIKNIAWEDGALYRCVVKQDTGDTDANHFLDLFVFEELLLNIPDVIVEDSPASVSCVLKLGASRNFQTSLVVLTIYDERFWSDKPTLGQLGAEPYIVTGFTQFDADDHHDGETMTCTAKMATQTNAYVLKVEEEMEVEWPPEDIEFEPDRSKYGLGQEIECKAEAKPEAGYAWKAIESPLGQDYTVQGAVLTITEGMMNSNESTSNEWTCLVSNKHGQISKTHSFSAELYVSSGPCHLMAPLMLFIITMVTAVF